MDILEYFFDYKQDKLFSNIRRVFATMVKEAELVETYQDSSRGLNVVKAKLQEVLPHYMKYILPRILYTGTSIDENDHIFKQDIGDDILDINEILGFDILPILFQQLCLNSNSLFEKKILHLMTRMYNQRREFADSVKDLLLLFELSNVRNYKKAKKIFITLQKYAEESEVFFFILKKLFR